MDADIERLASLAHAHSQMSQPGQSSQDTANGTKRKMDDDLTGSGKSKRSRYISLACNECKRRKIKCNGQTPCQRCGNLNLECVYSPNCCSGFRDSSEYKELTSHIVSLQEQVNMLYDNLNGLRAQLGHSLPAQQQQQTEYQLPSIDPSLQNVQSYNESTATARPRSQAQSHSAFRGLTSADFNFSVAKSSLQTMGMHALDTQDADVLHDTEYTENGERIYKHSDKVMRSGQMHDYVHEQKDPIWAVDHQEALRLCRIYEDETKLMYPVLDMSKIRAHLDRLFPFLAAMRRTGLMQQGMPGADAVEDEQTNVLKLVFAIALTAEGNGRSQLGKRFFDAVHPVIETLLLGDVNVNGIRLLVMTAVYEFQRDNESTSWRLIGLAARLCIELGLHRRETYDTIEDEVTRSETVLLFWACYVLDRRWSLGTGMPFALQDADIDPTLPRPDDRSPYLKAMIRYGEIGSKVWHSLAAPPSADNGGISPVNIRDMAVLDEQVLQWHAALPQSLQYDRQQLAPTDTLADRSSLRSQLVIYLRANQMRILIYQPVLHSATSITLHRSQSERVVSIAKNTISVLTQINQRTDLYRTQQVVFHAFLTSALAVLFLAISHTPAYFASEVRDEFYMALDLIRGLSKGSFVSKRLWKTIRGLKDIAPKLGLGMAEEPLQQDPTPSSSEDDPSRTAAVAMAGLAGHNVDVMSGVFSGSGGNINVDSQTPQTWTTSETDSVGNPEKMVNDLARLFAAAEGGQDSQQQQAVGSDGSAVASGQGELSLVLKDLF